MNYNDFIGKETISKEYKEFTFFKTDNNFELDQLENYCATNEFDFNDLVLENLKIYIKQYIPRYATSFWNSQIKQSEFYIGVDDYGIVKGIPYKGILPIDFIHEKIHKSFSKYIGTDDPLLRADLRNISIKTEFIKVVPFIPETAHHPDYLDFLKKKEIFLQKYNSFLEKYKSWKEKYNIINYKLVDIVNTSWSRKMLKEYVASFPNTEQIQELLDGDFKLESISGEELKFIKLDKTNMYYWVTEYKDHLTEQYKNSKPIFHEIFNKMIPFNLFISCELIPYWMKNKDMNLYVLKISMDILEKPTQYYSYYDFFQKKWLKYKRIVDQQPMCLQI